MRTIYLVLFWVAWLVVANAASALPVIENTLSVPTGLGNESQPMITVYRDRDDDKSFWWAPYQLVLAKDPLSLRPYLTWNAESNAARITMVVSLQPLAEAVTRRVRRELATQLSLSEDIIFLHPITLRDVTLEVRASGAENALFGEWQPRTSLLIQNVPDTIFLSPLDNQRMLRAFDHSPFANILLMAFNGTFLGFKKAGHYSKRLDSRCALAELAEGRSLAELGGRQLSARRLLAIASSMILRCTTEQREQGSAPDQMQVIATLTDRLSSIGIVTHEEDASGRWKVANGDRLESFGQSGAFEVSDDIPEQLGFFSASFGLLTHALAPTID